MRIEQFKKLYSLIRQRNAIFNEGRQEIEFACADENDVESFRQQLKNELNLDSYVYLEKNVRLDIRHLDYKLYWGTNDFRTRIFTKTDDGLNNKFGKDLAVVETNEESKPKNTLFFDSANKTTYVDFELKPENYFFSNAEYYLRFLQFLKGKEHKEDGFFHFVDHFSWDNEIVVFVSATKEGKLTVPFKQSVPLFLSHIDLKERLDQFFDSFDEADKTQKLPKFIKAEIFNKLSGEKRDERMSVWVDKMSEILEVANQNFDIYLSDLSMQNVKKDYLEAKDKYLAQLREILGKITTQIIALPVSTSAVAFATYNIPKTQNKNEIIYLLLFAFIGYTLFALFSLKLYKFDVEDASDQYNRDFELLEKSEFFIKYPSEIDYFLKMKNKVNQKLNVLRHTIYAYIAVLIITNSILIWKLLSEVDFYPVISIFLCEILFIAFLKPIVWDSNNQNRV